MSFTGPEGGLLTNVTPESKTVKMRKRGKVQNGTVLLEKITAQVHVDSENTASEAPDPPMPDKCGGELPTVPVQTVPPYNQILYLYLSQYQYLNLN